MNIPTSDNKKWNRLISGEINKDFDFFPLKLLLARLQLEHKLDKGQDTMERCITELRLLFMKNKNIPKAQDDLNKIFGKQKKVSLWRRIFRRG